MLNKPTSKIRTEDSISLPQYIVDTAMIDTASITLCVVVEGDITNSLLFTGVKVVAVAKIIDSVLMPRVVVEAGFVVQRALVADGVVIGANARVGSKDSEHIELVSKRVKGAE